MTTMIPTQFFYSLLGLDSNGQTIAYSNGQIDNNPSKEVLSRLLEITKKGNSKVIQINVTALTPLEFKVIDNV